jgi:hypothetical protein
MKRFLPMALVLVALSSGCTIPMLGIEIPGIPDIPGLGGATVVQYEHDILVIKSLEAVPTEIDAGQTAKIIAYIENIGDQPVGSVEEPVIVELYDYCEGLFTPRLLTCGDQQFAVTASTQGTTRCELTRMLPGEIVPVIWSVCQNRAPPVKVRTVCPPNGMKMLVRYAYTTPAVTTISLISLEEMQRELIERTYVSEESYIALGQGPIKPYLTVDDKQPVPVFDIAPGSSLTNPDVPNARTVLKFQLKNMGSGQLDTKVTQTTNTGGTRTVIGVPGYNITFTGIGSSNDLTPFPDKNDCLIANDEWDNEVVKFVGKESSAYYCKVALSPLKGDVERTTTRHIQSEVSYDYILTKNVMITVNPKITG